MTTSKEDLVVRIVRLKKYMPPHYSRVVTSKYPDINPVEIRKVVNYQLSETKQELKIVKILEELFYEPSRNNKQDKRPRKKSRIKPVFTTGNLGGNQR